MDLLSLHRCWEEGRKAVNGWCGIPDPVTAEIMAKHDFDSLTIDMQHGLMDFQAALGMLQAMRASGTTPLVRVPWNEPGIIMKTLDAGALGIICPMINTAEDAARLVSYTRYPPKGCRSSGPARASLVHGSSYHDESFSHIMAFAMVETREAMAELEAIAATPGLAGIYIGPSDLSISHGYAPGFDRQEAEMDAAIGTILDACKRNSIRACIHCGSPEYLQHSLNRGFDLATLSTDFRLLDNAIASAVAAARGNTEALQQDGSQTY